MNNMCGAQNANAFYDNLKTGNLPDPSSITYVGLFNQHYYDMGNRNQDKLLSLNNSFALTTNPFTKQKEIWIQTLITSSEDGKPRGPMPIDVVVVLDISGSMGSSLSNKSNRPKLELAKDAVQCLLSQSLRTDDKFALVTFNDKGYVLQQLELKSELNVKQMQETISKIQVNGGTTLQAGLGTGIDAFKKAYLSSPKGEHLLKTSNKQQNERMKRIIMITDMLDMGKDLDQMIKDATKQNIYVSVIGVGIDFNTQLTDIITKNEGSNYFCITEDQQMKEIIVDKFHFNFFPNVFNVSLRIESNDYQVIRSYGTPFDDTFIEASSDALQQYIELKEEQKVSDEQKQLQQQQSKPNMQQQCIAEINTMNSSHIIGNEVQGGIILVKLKQLDKVKQNGQVNLILSYMDKSKSNTFVDEYKIVISNEQKSEDIYSSKLIQKGLFLQRYAEMVIAFLSYFKDKQKITSHQVQKLQELQNYVKNQITLLEENKNQYKEISNAMKNLLEQSQQIMKSDTKNKLSQNLFY